MATKKRTLSTLTAMTFAAGLLFTGAATPASSEVRNWMPNGFFGPYDSYNECMALRGRDSYDNGYYEFRNGPCHHRPGLRPHEGGWYYKQELARIF